MAAMTPNQELRTNLISSVYNLGFQSYGGTWYSPVFSGGPRWAPRDFHLSGADFTLPYLPPAPDKAQCMHL